MAQGKKTKGVSSGSRRRKQVAKSRKKQMQRGDEAKQDIERAFAEEERKQEEEKLREKEGASVISTSEEIGVQSTQSSTSYQTSGGEQEKADEGLIGLILQVSAPVQNMIKPIKEKVSTNIQMAKNMYAMFQGMKQMYGGDTKKTLSVIFGFAKQEVKRRLEEKKNKIKEKVKEKFK